MGNRFDEDDQEYLELLAEYERYIRDTPGAYEDFDEWLELEQSGSRKKTYKPKRPNKKHSKE